MRTSRTRIGLVLVLVLVLGAAVVTVARTTGAAGRHYVTAYFDNSNGLFPGDEIRILGIAVGRIVSITPEPTSARVTFWYEDKYRVPADAKAVILSPSLVTSRAIQLTPAYTSGAVMGDDAVIPIERTAVPVEFDDLRRQLEKLTDALQPTQPGGVSTLGAFINTAADNLRGNGPAIRDSLTKLSQAFSILGDHSDDIFGTVHNLSILIGALRGSTELMRDLNVNLSAVTALLANSPDEVGNAVQSINDVVTDVRNFASENRNTVGTTSDQLAAVTQILADVREDFKQTLHVGPSALANFTNIYQPAQGTLTGALALNNFANPIQFLCSAVQAASRLGAEQSAKLCVQYLAPIVKNRQYNFLPVGLNPFVGAAARPNELTYTEDWLRPDYVTPPANAAPVPAIAAADSPPPPAEAPQPIPLTPSTDPAAGLPGLMIPTQGG